MYKIIRQFILILVMSHLLLVNANATLTGISVTNLSGTSNISSTNTSTVTIRWSMQSVGTNPLYPGEIISSTTGRFTNGAGGVLGTNNKVLSKRITPTFPSSTVTITETVRIPKKILYIAAQKNLTQITYERTFTDCPGDVCNTPGAATITFNIAANTGSIFSVTNYKLRFDNDQVRKIIPVNDKLNAFAYINVSRTGTVKGVWEIASPATTSGQPSYRIIRTVQKQVNTFTDNRLISPVLPTTSPGVYLVRFRFTDPLLDGTVPTLAYVVRAKQASRHQLINTISPLKGSSLSEKTRFEWNPVKGAYSYQLEFIEASNGDPDKQPIVAGVLVKPGNTKKIINKMISTHLKPGKHYLWHVIALDKKGYVIGESEWTMIRAKK